MRMTATLLQVWAAYSPVKNSVADSVAKVAAGLPSHSATSGELDIYAANCRHDAVLSPLLLASSQLSHSVLLQPSALPMRSALHRTAAHYQSTDRTASMCRALI